MNKMTFEEIYLDWVNNFLTIEKFSEHYNISFEEASIWLLVCSKLYNSKIKL